MNPGPDRERHNDYDEAQFEGGEISKSLRKSTAPPGRNHVDQTKERCQGEIGLVSVVILLLHQKEKIPGVENHGEGVETFENEAAEF